MYKIWSLTMTLLGGLKRIRDLDMIATIRKVSNEHFRTHEIDGIAKHQMEIFRQELREHIPSLDDEEKYVDLIDWLKGVMIMKMDLLVSNKHHKLAFPPPGASYDAHIMDGITEDNVAPKKGQEVHYRVKLCWSPAVYENIAEPEWTDANALDSHPEKYKEALLESRNFFAEEPGKYQGWEGSFLAAQAQVIIEEIPGNPPPKRKTVPVPANSGDGVKDTPSVAASKQPTQSNPQPSASSAATKAVTKGPQQKSTNQSRQHNVNPNVAPKDDTHTAAGKSLPPYSSQGIFSTFSTFYPEG
jgi:hypothetical protein